MLKKVLVTDLFVETPGTIEPGRKYRLHLVFVTPAGRTLMGDPLTRMRLEHVLGSRLMPCDERDPDRYEIEQLHPSEDLRFHADILCYGLSYAFKLFVDHRSTAFDSCTAKAA